MVKEEGTLFPLLQRDDAVAAHVTELAAEHATLYDAVDDLEERSLDRAPGFSAGWAGAVVEVLMDLNQHKFKEDFGLLPAALTSLDWADWNAVDRYESDHAPADTTDAGRSGRDVRPLPVRAWSAQDRPATRQPLGSQEDR